MSALPTRSRLWYLRRSVWRDVRNLVRHGVTAPRWGELVWLDPNACTSFSPSHNRSYTGQVLDGDWDLAVSPLDIHEKFVACRKHWIEGKTWQETGVIDRMLDEIAQHGSKDGVRTANEVEERYRRLDVLYTQVESEGRLRTRHELDPRAFREVGGIYMHVGRDGTPIFGNGGCHRLAIAQIVGLERVPAQVGVVHEQALQFWRDLFSEEIPNRTSLS